MDASSAFKDSLPTPPETLLDKLTCLDISFTTHTHLPLRTVEDAKAFRGDLPGAHIKNLYLRDRKKHNFLIVVQEDRQIDLKSFGGQIGSDRLSFGSADRLFEMLGVRPGAVSPFALINDSDHKVQLILDADLADQSCLYAHPLVNDVTLGLSGADLLRFTTFTGHQPQLLSFA
jgi:Ala-tRNA(Pro) deacylase